MMRLACRPRARALALSAVVAKKGDGGSKIASKNSSKGFLSEMLQPIAEEEGPDLEQGLLVQPARRTRERDCDWCLVWSLAGGTVLCLGLFGLLLAGVWWFEVYVGRRS